MRRRSMAAIGCALFAGTVLLYRPLTGFAQGAVVLPYPVMFVTQVPVPQDFTTRGSLFGNHMGDVASAARGGDLWIRYGDGTSKNLTQAAGYGVSGFQGTTSIAVREPSVHWSGTKAVFSMVIGGASRQYELGAYYWQLYEITGLGPSDTPVITKVPNQPPDYNNVSPIYGTDDRLIFTSDRARDGQRHLSPQRDEYEVAPVVSGLWSLLPATGDLFMLQQSPSGSFSPQIDSFGRVVYIRWDHLQRDQLADGDTTSNAGYGAFNYADESAAAARLHVRTEVFPEPRGSRTDLLAGTNLEGHTFNDFFPWMINEDGTEEETINHLGRHELHGYFNRSLNDDPNLREFTSATPRTNPNVVDNFLHIEEDPNTPGLYYGIDAPEFQTHSAGQVVRMNAGVGVNPDATIVTYVTHRDTHSYTSTPSVNHSGLYRDPLPLSNGVVIAAHTSETRADANTGTRTNPGSRYGFRLMTLGPSGSACAASQPLTGGISKTVSWWDPDVMVSYAGPLWELDPVEVRARTRPTRTGAPLPSEVLQVFAQQGVPVSSLQAFMRANGLALIVTNNVTTRDRADRQQPFNLRVAGTATQTIGAGGRVYDVSHLQLFQADQIRGIGGLNTPRPGRRVLAQPMHAVPAHVQPTAPGGPPSSVAIAQDGSVAAFVPSRRAMSWQLTGFGGTPVVRERYWITMQPGEVRVCTSCHGINSRDQANQTAPHNPPQALAQLLVRWRSAFVGPLAPTGVRIQRTS
jgi:hypothetical protein